jgi:hypothetical protein
VKHLVNRSVERNGLYEHWTDPHDAATIASILAILVSLPHPNMIGRMLKARVWNLAAAAIELVGRSIVSLSDYYEYG